MGHLESFITLFPVTPSLPGWQTSRPCMTHTLQKLSNTMPSASSGTSMPNTKHQHQASSTGSSAPPRIQISQQPPPPHSRQLNRSQFQPPLRVLDSVIHPPPNLHPWQSTKTRRDTVTHLLTRSSQSSPTPSSPSVPSPEVVSSRTLPAVTDADKLMSVRKTANYDATGAAIATCKKSYLMITAVWNVATAAKTVEMIITTSKWANTLE